MSEKEHKDLIENQTSRQLNHLVRTDDELKGIINVEVKHGEFNIKIHKGTEAEATSIEGLNKQKLIELFEEKV